MLLDGVMFSWYLCLFIFINLDEVTIFTQNHNSNLWVFNWYVYGHISRWIDFSHTRSSNSHPFWFDWGFRRHIGYKSIITTRRSSFAIVPSMKKLTTHHKLPIDPYEIFILLLTSLSFLTLIVLSVPYFDSAAQQIALTLDLILSILFMLDFLYTLFTVPDKRAYLKWGWLDFLGSLPYLPFLRILRIFRAIRSLRVMQQNKFREIWQDVKNRPERSTLFGVVLFGLILVSLSSYAILQIENTFSWQQYSHC